MLIKPITRFEVGSIKVEVHPDSKSAGSAAAQATAHEFRRLSRQRELIAAVFATGASQMDILGAMVSIPDLPWNRVWGFHLDEYLGINANHPASFRWYLRENLTSRVAMREFHEIDGSSPDPESVCRVYAEKLRAAEPQICLLGIGENGHLAFNDPGEADFRDPADMKVVRLDAACRRQQVAEGWFADLNEVPERALTMTIPAVLRIPMLIVSVPGKRKAQAVRRALDAPISTKCPATILRTHPNVHLYLDVESAAELGEI